GRSHVCGEGALCHKTMLQGFVARAGGVALVIVGQFAVGAEAVAGTETPEGSIVTVRDRGVPHGFDIQTFPAEVLTAVRTDPGQAGTFSAVGIHGYAPAAANRARLTATCASFTLYA